MFYGDDIDVLLSSVRRGLSLVVAGVFYERSECGVCGIVLCAVLCKQATASVVDEHGTVFRVHVDNEFDMVYFDWWVKAR